MTIRAPLLSLPLLALAACAPAPAGPAPASPPPAPPQASRLEIVVAWEQGPPGGAPLASTRERTRCVLRPAPGGWRVEGWRAELQRQPGASPEAATREPFLLPAAAAPESLALGPALTAGWPSFPVIGAARTLRRALRVAGHEVPIDETWRVVAADAEGIRLRLSGVGHLALRGTDVLLLVQCEGELVLSPDGRTLRRLEHRARCRAAGGPGEDAEARVSTVVELVPLS